MNPTTGSCSSCIQSDAVDPREKWQRNGFQVVGSLPGAFRHRRLGYVDGLVLFQGLVDTPGG